MQQLLRVGSTRVKACKQIQNANRVPLLGGEGAGRTGGSGVVGGMRGEGERRRMHARTHSVQSVLLISGVGQGKLLLQRLQRPLLRR